MIRSTSRSEVLCAFGADLAAIGELAEAMRQHVGDAGRVRMSAEIPGEHITFESSAELLSESTKLPSSVRKFSILALSTDLGDSRSLRLESSGLFRGAYVSATGPNAVWCAAGTGIVRDFALRYRRWYSPLPRWLFSLATVLFALAPWFYRSLSGRLLLVSSSSIVAWAVTLVLLFLLDNRHDIIFPRAVIIVRIEESFWKKYATEISAAAALVSAAAAALSLLRP